MHTGKHQSQNKGREYDTELGGPFGVKYLLNIFLNNIAVEVVAITKYEKNGSTQKYSINRNHGSTMYRKMLISVQYCPKYAKS